MAKSSKPKELPNTLTLELTPYEVRTIRQALVYALTEDFWKSLSDRKESAYTLYDKTHKLLYPSD